MSAVPSLGRPRTTRETAEFFKVTPRTIRRWVKDGLMTCAKSEGVRGAVRFRDEDIAARLDRMSTGSVKTDEPQATRNPKYAARTAA